MSRSFSRLLKESPSLISEGAESILSSAVLGEAITPVDSQPPSRQQFLCLPSAPAEDDLQETSDHVCILGSPFCVFLSPHLSCQIRYTSHLLLLGWTLRLKNTFLSEVAILPDG